MHGETLKVSAQNSGTGESPKRKNTTFRTRRKFEIKKIVSGLTFKAKLEENSEQYYTHGK